MKKMGHRRSQEYGRHVYLDADEREFIALCTEFPHVSAFGGTAAEALAELDVALEGAIAVYEEEGWPLPTVAPPPEPVGLPSGKFVVRLPRSLHAQLVASSANEGVSLNALVISLLAAGVAGGTPVEAKPVAAVSGPEPGGTRPLGSGEAPPATV